MPALAENADWLRGCVTPPSNPRASSMVVLVSETATKGWVTDRA
jgi:hypothetical protein